MTLGVELVVDGGVGGEELQRRHPAPLRLHEDVEYFALVVNGSPQAVTLAANSDKDLVEISAA